MSDPRRLSLLAILLLFACRPEEEPVDPLSIRGDPIPPAPGPAVAEAAPPEAPRDPLPSGASAPPGHQEVTFDFLASFEYRLPSDMTRPVPGELEGKSELIPEDIHALNGREISLRGFMLPLKVEETLVTEFLIMRDQSMCCYGTVPLINEWVNVRMKDEGVEAVMDIPVTVHGTLKVGEFREGGYLVGIYDMDATRITTSGP